MRGRSRCPIVRCCPESVPAILAQWTASCARTSACCEASAPPEFGAGAWLLVRGVRRFNASAILSRSACRSITPGRIPDACEIFVVSPMSVRTCSCFFARSCSSSTTCRIVMICVASRMNVWALTASQRVRRPLNPVRHLMPLKADSARPDRRLAILGADQRRQRQVQDVGDANNSSYWTWRTPVSIFDTMSFSSGAPTSTPTSSRRTAKASERSSRGRVSGHDARVVGFAGGGVAAAFRAVTTRIRRRSVLVGLPSVARSQESSASEALERCDFAARTMATAWQRLAGNRGEAAGNGGDGFPPFQATRGHQGELRGAVRRPPRLAR